ncbi:MAG: hypothetical protein KAI99_01240 [Cyclobacteriaceae bacterium]|nr:hypothetical protein [Cyclobacteriaceae bacterium]
MVEVSDKINDSTMKLIGEKRRMTGVRIREAEIDLQTSKSSIFPLKNIYSKPIN